MEGILLGRHQRGPGPLQLDVPRRQIPEKHPEIFKGPGHRGGGPVRRAPRGVAAPALLPWIPGSAFAIKGLWAGLAAALPLLVFFRGSAGWLASGAMLLTVSAISSFLAMNFTGSTPFTSPSGVEKEMRRAIPAQAVGMLIAAILWVGAGFMG